MRLLLDAHISGPRVARALRERGHDVLAVDEERVLDGTPDEAFLILAAEQERVLITFDVKDFPLIVQRWAEAQRTHAGCMLMVGIDHGEFGAIIEAIDRQAARRPKPADWIDYAVFVGRDR